MPDETDNKSDIKPESSLSSTPDPKKSLTPKPQPELKSDKVATVGKKKAVKKSKYEDLPEIPDYDHPELEKYEESEFTPTKYEKAELKPVEEEKKTAAETKPKTLQVAKKKDLPEIEDYEKPDLEKYEKTGFAPTKKNLETDEQKKEKNIKSPTQRPEEELKKNLKPVLKAVSAETENKDSTGKPKLNPNAKYEDLPLIEEHEGPQLEKYVKSDFEPTKKDESAPEKSVAELKQEKIIAPPGEPKNQKRMATKIDESVADKKSLLKPSTRGKPKPVTEESTEVTLGKPKSPLKSSTGETADAKIKQKKPGTPSVKEESVSKNIVIDGEELQNPFSKDDAPIEIQITEPDEQNSKKAVEKLEDDSYKKSVSFDKNAKSAEAEEKKKIRRSRYDPMAYIPDEDVIMEEEPSALEIAVPETPIPVPSIVRKPSLKYDPFRYIPDKDDSPSVENVDDTEVNKTQTPYQLHIHRY